MERMKDRICMVTGGNAGIGKETAQALAQQGGHVVIVSRNPQRGEDAAQEIRAATGNQMVDVLICDYASQDSIREMTAQFNRDYPRLDVLVNNAGLIMMSRETTVDGLEVTFAVNHLGYFMNTLLLMESLAKGDEVRIVNVSSDAHRGAKMNFDDLMGEKKYSGFGAYSQSKLANVLFTYELDRRLAGSGITTNALHPGFVATGFNKNNGGLMSGIMSIIGKIAARSPEKGAETSIYLASSPDVAGLSGLYYSDCEPVTSSAESYDQESAQRLWDVSLELTGLPDLVTAS
jgi:NAD(P)-dependent dehydrogenase (short-subunit alcohol dehydrogenase family)